MTTMTDLTKERLDALERFVRGEDEDEGTAVSLHPDLLLALIAMARGKQRAERERDAYVALADAKAAEATALGRERDALREELELWRAAALCEAGSIVPIDDAQPTTDAGGAE